MNFQDFPYTRPVESDIKNAINAQLMFFKLAKNAATQAVVINEINRIFNQLTTQRVLVSIRHAMNTRDSFYEDEQDFFDRFSPQISEWKNQYYKALTGSRFRNDLEKTYGKQLFRLAEIALESFSPAIMEDLAEENQLTTRYVKLLASAQIPFDDKILNLSQLDPFTQSPVRATRRAAVEAKFAFFEKHEEELDEIFSALVTVRHRMAKKLAYDNFIELGYKLMLRTDYGPTEVKAFRKQVKRDLVPLASALRKRQAKRLGLDKLAFHDEGISFLSGNAVPQGNSEWILEHGKKMYDELSEETSEFFRSMTAQSLLDLVAREGKAGGGFCDFLPDYKVPFIFSNFNGTAGDIEVLTHEAGHAFQAYRSRNMPVPEYYFPTMDAAEIHSMSMEFLTWPWMEQFFRSQTEKFKFNHLTEALLFIPYGVTVDAFQHWVYAHPEASPKERKAQWRKLEKEFLPSRNYDSIDYLERGGFWMRQSHIFEAPFYYIDYTLAQTCALQLWHAAQQDREQAWQRYLELCDLGGSQAFTELLQSADLKNPFEEGCLASILPAVQEYLDAVDDSRL